PQKPFAPGFGPSGKGRPFGPSTHFGAGFGAGLDAVAKALGITTDELKTDLAKGMSIADIAKSKNLDVNKGIDQLVADANAKIDEAVKNGKLPQDLANKLKDGIRSAITAFVNGDLPRLRFGEDGGFGFKFGGRHGFGPHTPWMGPGSAPGSAP